MSVKTADKGREMRRSILLGAALGALLVVGSAGGAFAGEIGGNGEVTPAGEKANSYCAFSGLQDFDLLKPVEPGAVQNWGQIPKATRDAWSVKGAAVVNNPFGPDGCNAHLVPSK